MSLTIIHCKTRPAVMFKTSAARTTSEGLDKRLMEVVQQAYIKPFSLQSDFARSNAFFVAAAASLGYLTTRTTPRSFHYGHLWRTTGTGHKFMEKE